MVLNTISNIKVLLFKDNILLKLKLMNRISWIFVLVWLCTSCGLSQLSLYKGKYKKFLQAGETEVYTNYSSVTSKKLEDEMVYRKFFPETKQITHYFEYNKSTSEKNGPYKEWYDDGTLIINGQYQNNKKNGQWYIHDKGTGNYVNDLKEGEWKLNDEKGQLSAIYHYLNDKKEGPFIEYDTSGQIKNEGIYRADTIYTQSKAIESSIDDQMPMFASTCTNDDIKEKQKCAETAMLNHVYKTLRYPSFARENDIQGQAIVKFVVGKDGNIKDIVVLRGVCESIKKEVTRLMKSFPTWKPGYKNGRVVSVWYTLPISFSLK